MPPKVYTRQPGSVGIRQQSCPIGIKTKKAKWETHDGQNRFRLFAARKSLRPMRQADRSPRMGRERPALHLVSLALPGLRLSVRGDGYFRARRIQFYAARSLTVLPFTPPTAGSVGEPATGCERSSHAARGR